MFNLLYVFNIYYLEKKLLNIVPFTKTLDSYFRTGIGITLDGHVMYSRSYISIDDIIDIQNRRFKKR